MVVKVNDFSRVISDKLREEEGEKVEEEFSNYYLIRVKTGANG